MFREKNILEIIKRKTNVEKPKFTTTCSVPNKEKPFEKTEYEERKQSKKECCSIGRRTKLKSFVHR